MKHAKICALAFLFLLLFCLPARAQDAEFQEDGAYDFSSELSEQTREILSRLGVDGIDYETLLNTSPKKMIDLIVDLLREGLRGPLRTVGRVLGIVTVTAAAGCFLKKRSEGETLTETVCALLMISIMAPPVSKALTAALSAVRLNADFMLLYIPVFTGTVAAGGQPLTASVYSALSLGAAEAVSQLCAVFFPSLVGLILCFVFLSCVSSGFHSEKAVELLKKLITVLLGVTATVFVGMVTLKGLLASSADTAAIRGVKLMAGNAIPIVGSAIGDAFASVLSSLALVRNTVGIFGLIAIAVTVLPPVIELLIWYFLLGLCSLFCSFLGAEGAERMLGGISSCVALINTLTVFSSVVFILSTGLILSMRS